MTDVAALLRKQQMNGKTQRGTDTGIQVLGRKLDEWTPETERAAVTAINALNNAGIRPRDRSEAGETMVELMEALNDYRRAKAKAERDGFDGYREGRYQEPPLLPDEEYIPKLNKKKLEP